MAASLPDPPAGNGSRRRLTIGWLESYIGLLVLGFAGFTLGPSLVGAKVLASVNTLTRYLPWQAGGLEVRGHQICTTDTIDAVLPGVAYIRDRIYSGDPGTWQSLVGGGGPMFANPNTGLVDPLSWPFLIFPLWMAPAVVVLVELIAAVVGMTLFLRWLGAGRAAGILAGFVYATSGFMVVWTNWPQTRVAALIPLLLWAVERLLQRLRITDVLIVGLVVAAMLFGGFPQVTAYALYFAGGYLLVRLYVLHRRRLRAALRPVGLAIGGLVLGGGLSMVQMLPFVSNVNSMDLSYRGKNLSGLPTSSLITTVSPNAYGSCIFPNHVRVTVNPIEFIAYIGAAALVLAVAGAASGRTRPRDATRGARGYVVAAMVLVLLVAWISPTLRRVVQDLPVFSTTFIGRIRVILGFGLAVLAGLGLDAMQRGRASRRAGEVGTHRTLPPRWRRLLWPTVVWIGAGVGAALVLRMARHYAFRHHFSAALNDAVTLPLILGTVALVAYALARTGVRVLKVLALLVVPALVVVQGASFFHTILPGDSPSNFYPVTGTHRFLLKHVGHDRYGAQGPMMSATSLYYGLRTATGHVFHDSHWRALLRQVDPDVMQSPTYSAFTPALSATAIADQPILDRMGVTYFVLPPDQVTGSVGSTPPAAGTVSTGRTGSLGCTVPGQALRGIEVTLADGLDPVNNDVGTTLRITVQDGRRTISSGRFVGGPLRKGTTLRIPVAGEDLSAVNPLQVRVSADGASGPLVLVGAGGGSARCVPVGPADDGLRLVYADSASVIYQRLTALPRIRWSGSAEVMTDGPQRLDALTRGVPAGTVVLSKPGPTGSGKPAQVEIAEDSGAHITATVKAEGGGYLVVADAMQQPGWTVTVDGHATALVAADGAMVGVYVPAGTHKVAFSYLAPGQVAGAAITGVTVLIMIGLLVFDRRRSRRDDGPEEEPLDRDDEGDPVPVGETSPPDGPV